MAGCCLSGRFRPETILWLLVVAASQVWWGCGPRQAAPGAEDRQPGSGGIAFEALLGNTGVRLWRQASEPQTGEGLEGLAALVDGAAEGLWQQGVAKAVFQEFTVGEGSAALEFQRYVFRSVGEAARYLEALCRESRAPPARLNACAEFCLISGETASQGLVRLGAEVTEMRAYAPGCTADPLIEQLVKTMGRLGCR